MVSNDESTKPRIYSFVIFALDLPVNDVEDMNMRKHCVLVQYNESDSKVKIIHTIITKRWNDTFSHRDSLTHALPSLKHSL